MLASSLKQAEKACSHVKQPLHGALVLLYKILKQ